MELLSKSRAAPLGCLGLEAERERRLSVPILTLSGVELFVFIAAATATSRRQSLTAGSATPTKIRLSYHRLHRQDTRAASSPLS